MSQISFVGFSGSASRPSKTRALVERALELAAARFGGTAETFDVLDLEPDLLRARRLGDLGGTARAFAERFVAADGVAVASPIYKGSYSGLFKHFIDLLDPAALRGKPVLLLASGGGERHALSIEHQFRPVFGFFEAATLPTGIYAAERDFTSGRPSAPALLERLEIAVGQFAPHLPDAASARRPAVPYPARTLPGTAISARSFEVGAK